jgi:transcriptional regulator with XRE-family HTH domain
MPLSKLIEKLRNKVFRSSFVSAQVRRLVTSQIKALRESKRWTQGELGLRAGMKANAISRLENPDYGDFTINTLLRLAKAFDVGLIVRFAPFSELAMWNESVSPKDYVPPDFEHDRRLVALSSASSFYRRKKFSANVVSNISQIGLFPEIANLASEIPPVASRFVRPIQGIHKPIPAFANPQYVPIPAYIANSQNIPVGVIQGLQ